MGVDAGELVVLDERGDHRPVIAAFVGTGEQGVLAVQREGHIERSTMLLSRSMRPSSRKRDRRVADRFAELDTCINRDFGGAMIRFCGRGGEQRQLSGVYGDGCDTF